MTSSLTPARAAADRFFVVITLAMLIGVLVGFAPTFYLRSTFDGPALPWWLTVHGVTQTAWYLLLVAQATLNAQRQRQWHRRLGWGTVVVAGLGMAIAPLVMVRAVPRGLAAGLLEFEVDFVFLVNLLRLPFFVAMLAMAIRRPRSRETHARALVLASLSNFTPAASRLSHLVGVSPLWGALGALLAFGLPVAWHDRRALGRVHPVTSWGLTALVLIIVIPIALLSAGWGQPLVVWLAR